MDLKNDVTRFTKVWRRNHADSYTWVSHVKCKCCEHFRGPITRSVQTGSGSNLRSVEKPVATCFPANCKCQGAVVHKLWGHRNAPNTIHAQSTRTECTGQFKPETVTGNMWRKCSDAQSTPLVQTRPSACKWRRKQQSYSDYHTRTSTKSEYRKLH